MNWANYILQTNIYLVLFYGFYLLFLKNETFFQLNRIYLLGSALVSLIIPVFYFDWVKELLFAQELQESWTTGYFLIQDGMTAVIAEERQWVLGDYLTIFYLTGAAVFFLVFIAKLMSLRYFFKKTNASNAFSFFRKISIGSTLPEKDVILLHEQAHVKQWHTLDLLFFELLKIFNWFNPVSYLYKKDVQHVHEFIADEQVICAGKDKQDYARILFNESFGVHHQLTNTFFNKSLLKRRIQMLNKQKSRRVAILKYGLSVPLFLIAMVFSSARISESKTIKEFAGEIQSEKALHELLVPKDSTANTFKPSVSVAPDKKKISLKPKTLTTNKDSITASAASNEVVVVGYSLGSGSESKRIAPLKRAEEGIYLKVDVSPQYPGGMEAFYKFLGEHVNYPKPAREKNIEGRVVTNFIVEKDGSLTGLKILKGVPESDDLDKEALRVLKLSPKWKPGIKDGQPVRVSYTVPILFSLDKAKTIHKIGVKSPSKDKEPYILVDGKAINRAEMDTIDPKSIESISVLKDKSATAIYGEKGENGVILITLKK